MLSHPSHKVLYAQDECDLHGSGWCPTCTGGVPTCTHCLVSGAELERPCTKTTGLALAPAAPRTVEQILEDWQA